MSVTIRSAVSGFGIVAVALVAAVISTHNAGAMASQTAAAIFGVSDSASAAPTANVQHTWP